MTYINDYLKYHFKLQINTIGKHLQLIHYIQLTKQTKLAHKYNKKIYIEKIFILHS